MMDRSSEDQQPQSITYQTEWRVDTTPGGAMNQLALIPLDTLEPSVRQPGSRIISMPGRSARAPRVAVGAPGYLSVRAASEQLGLRPRSVRSLIERGRITSQRLGRIHFIPQAQVDQYRRIRKARAARARTRQRSLG
jgi:excisionase family DNA binding protein